MAAVTEQRRRVTTDMTVEEAKGLPRPLVPYETDSWYTERGFERSKMIVPWLNWGPSLRQEDFTIFDEGAVEEVRNRDFNVCTTCGQDLGENRVFGLIGPVKEGQRLGTSGTAMHPQCALLAYHYCPHLHQRGDQAFALYTGEGHGHEIPADYEDEEVDLAEILGDGFLSSDARVIDLAELKALAAEEKRGDISTVGDLSDLSRRR